MATDNMKTSDKTITTDAKLLKLPTVLVPMEEDKEEEKTKPGDNHSPNDVISNSSVASTATLLRKKQKLQSTYEMEKFYQHAMLVLNHKKVKGYRPRHGTEKDAKALDETLSKLGFKVEVENDLPKVEVMKKLIEFCGRDFSEYGCVAVVVLSHGRQNGDIVSSDGLFYYERDIIKFLKSSNNPTLVGKPRILVIQACRAFESNISISKGVKVYGAESTGEETPEAEPAAEIKHYFLPVESNMLVVHSSYIGKYSFRSEDKGSWFIQEFCKKINQLAPSVDLDSILTEIKREVAIHDFTVHNKTDSGTDDLKQMPVTTSTLTRKLYLRHREKSALRQHAETHLKRRVELRDDQNLASAAPLRFQYGPCFCFLDHYNYMLNCLRCYLKEHSDDDAAKVCYSLASEFEHGPAFHGTKVKMLKTISECLNKTTFKYKKYVHFYN